MRAYCTQNGGDCFTCSLVSYRKDCQNNPLPPLVGTYTIGSSADDLEGWTARTLAQALRSQLGALGVRVKCSPNESGVNEGLLLLETETDFSPWIRDTIRDAVQDIVNKVIQG